MVKQLADILLEGGLVDEAELAAAYDEHQRAGRSLGRVLVEHGVEALVEHIRSWQEQLAALQTMLGATTTEALTQQELILHGALLEFCASRGIDPAAVVAGVGGT